MLLSILILVLFLIFIGVVQILSVAFIYEELKRTNRILREHNQLFEREMEADIPTWQEMALYECDSAFPKPSDN